MINNLRPQVYKYGTMKVNEMKRIDYKFAICQTIRVAYQIQKNIMAL